MPSVHLALKTQFQQYQCPKTSAIGQTVKQPRPQTVNKARQNVDINSEIF